MFPKAAADRHLRHYPIDVGGDEGHWLAIGVGYDAHSWEKRLVMRTC